MNAFIAIVGGFLSAIVTGVLYSLLGGLFFMLAVGVIHAEWLPTLPTIGYGWSVIVSFLIRAAITSQTASTKS